MVPLCSQYWLPFAVALTCLLKATKAQYQPTWESLDSRPLPDWYDKAKFGIFVHWGVFSVPSFKSEWFWWYWQGNDPQKDVVDFMEKNYPPGFTYADFGPQFTVEFFDADQWADIFSASGAKYIVLTSKHHEGFSLWNSSVSFNWNAVDVGPHQDLVGVSLKYVNNAKYHGRVTLSMDKLWKEHITRVVGTLAQSVRNRTDLHFGLYHSMFEWFNPLFLHDQQTGFKTQLFPQMKTIPELYEIVNMYHPDIIWSDGDESASDTYWTSKEFLAWLYNESPVKDTVVTNDRWGAGVSCHHGGYYTCSDRFNPGILQKHKWENCMTIDSQSWGYRREATLDSYLTIEDILESLISTVSCGGNLLLNVGPTKEGRIAPIYEERLRQVGQWLSINGEAIFDTSPWTSQNDSITSNVWYTSRNSNDARYESVIVYAIALKWPHDNILTLGSPMASPKTRIYLLGYNESLSWTHSPEGDGIIIMFPDVTPSTMPCQWAWTLKICNLFSDISTDVTNNI